MAEEKEMKEEKPLQQEETKEDLQPGEVKLGTKMKVKKSKVILDDWVAKEYI